jgi:hypothetical protein
MEGGEGGSTTASLNDDGAPVVAAEGSCNWEEVGKALRASSTGSSVSADDDRDNELKLAREAARE